MNKDLPGYEEARRLGYSVNFYGSDYRSVTYTEGLPPPEGLRLPFLHLGVWMDSEGKLQAKLSFNKGLLTVSTLPFSFPHPRFSDLWEKPILDARRKLE